MWIEVKTMTEYLSRISPDNLMYLWSELHDAYYDNNDYGSDEAELYACHFGHQTGNMSEESGLEAANALNSLLQKFKQYKRCKIYVEEKLLGNGKWLIKQPFLHRVHVKIEKLK
jgi:hypothetical protein